MSKIKNYFFLILFILSFITISFYIPLSIMIYSPVFYEHNYQNQNTYQILTKEFSQNQTNNLINYFLNKEELNQNWSNNEKIHYKDVKQIYFILQYLFLFSLILYFLLFKIKYVKIATYSNLILNTALITILPIFSIFWDKYFHQALFSNNAWLISSNEISYYLFSLETYSFFINSFIFLISFNIISNILILVYLKLQEKSPNL